jgi:hypothetical protein
MATDVEIDRALAAIRATLNDQRPEEFDRERVQELVTGALGEQENLTVDDGGGVHDESGRRVGAIRKAPGGEWLVERQNSAAENSDVAIPTAPKKSVLRKLFTKLTSRA